MIITSEKTHKTYETVEECIAAEKAFDEEQARKEKAQKQLQSERKARAEEIEVARKAMNEAQNNYRKLVEAFVRDYKSYHTTILSVKDLPSFIREWFDMV